MSTNYREIRRQKLEVAAVNFLAGRGNPSCLSKVELRAAIRRHLKDIWWDFPSDDDGEYELGGE